MKDAQKTPEQRLAELEAANLGKMHKIARFVFENGRKVAGEHVIFYDRSFRAIDGREVVLRLRDMERLDTEDFGSLLTGNSGNNDITIDLVPEQHPGFSIRQSLSGNIGKFEENRNSGGRQNWLPGWVYAKDQTQAGLNLQDQYEQVLDNILGGIPNEG